VTGPLGSGKSYYAVRKATEALEANKVVVTNFRMTPDWHERVVDRHPLRWLMPGRRKRLKARWRRSVKVVPDLKTLMRIRVDGEGEGRAVVVIDEAHVFMNARNWRDEDRMALVEWASASRKLGLEVYLVTQDLQSLDRQVRDRLTYHIELSNLKQFKVMGIPVVPFNFFVAIWKYHGAGKAIVKRELYRLDWRARLYDTMDLGTFASILNPADAIRLPTPAAAPPPPGHSLASATSAEGAAAPRGAPDDRSRRALVEISDAIARGEVLDEETITLDREENGSGSSNSRSSPTSETPPHG
jgi:hypothetical protein